MIDAGTADSEGYRVGDTIGVAAEGPVAGVRDRRHRPVRRRRLARGTRPSPSSTCRRRRRCSRSAGELDEIFVAAQRGVSPEQLVREIRAVLPASVEVQTGAESAREETGRGHRVHRHLPLLPARLRRHRALRRRLRHLQHALDHGRAAHARVRHAAHDRRLPPPGARLGRARGARDRLRLGR